MVRPFRLFAGQPSKRRAQGRRDGEAKGTQNQKNVDNYSTKHCFIVVGFAEGRRLPTKSVAKLSPLKALSAPKPGPIILAASNSAMLP